MNRRKFLGTSTAALASGLVSVQSRTQAAGAPKATKPNVLMITCHDIGQHLHCYGIETVRTPNLDRLAARGVRFENVYSTSAVCSPGRGSLHTGRYPQSNGLMGLTHAPWWWELKPAERHTASLLRDHGYETWLVGYNHIDRADPDRLGYTHKLSKACKAEETAAAAAQLVTERVADDAPFFAKVGFREVHRPFTHGKDTEKGVFVPGWLQDTPAARDDLAAFQATIHYFDTLVGQILDALEQSGIADNTIVIMTSDHGIPYPGAKWSVRRAGVIVPLILYQPNTSLTGGKVFQQVMSNVDVLPTLLDWVEAPIPDNVEGVSFKKLLLGETDKPPRQSAFAQYTPDMKRDNESRCVLTGRYHLIHYFGAGRAVDYPVAVDPKVFAAHRERCATRGRARPFAQLYDLENDPLELHEIGSEPENAGLVRDLTRQLLAWMVEVDDPLLSGPTPVPYYQRAIEALRDAGR